MATPGAIKLDQAYKVTQVLLVPTLALVVWFATGMVDGIHETQAQTNARVEKTKKDVTDIAMTLERALASLDRRVIQIEATRFTINDAAAIQSTITALWKEIADRPRKGELPPEWLLERIAKIEHELEKLEEEIHKK